MTPRADPSPPSPVGPSEPPRASGPAATWTGELRRLGALAGPIVLVQVGLMTLGLVDTMVVGRVSAEALAAVALGHLYSFWLLGTGMGVLLALDPVVAQALGAGDEDAAARNLQRGLVLVVLLSVPIALLLLATEPVLRALGQPEEIVPLAADYARATIVGVPGFLAFVVLRQVLQARDRVAPLVAAIVAANVANLVLNVALVFGRLGAPRLGAVGSGWATAATRWLLVLLVVALALRALRPSLERLRREALALRPLLRLLGVGAPIGAQHGLEMGTFSAIALFMGWIGTVEVAANQVALALISTTFMIPLGISAAAAVRVGRAVGAGDPLGARRAASCALATGTIVMSVSAVLFVVAPTPFARAFTADAAVLATSASLLRVAGVFQLFDGLQVVAVGVLRGLGETRAPVVINVVGFVLLAIPLALWLGFVRGLGAVGLWWGLAAGLAAVAVVLLLRVRRDLRGELVRLDVEGPAARVST